jgi:hypothetical protein
MADRQPARCEDCQRESDKLMRHIRTEKKLCPGCAIVADGRYLIEFERKLAEAW